MEKIDKSELWTFLSNKDAITRSSNDEVRGDRGHEVSSYLELARKVAELQYLNRDHVLLFRGQGADFMQGDSLSSIHPSLFRSDAGRREPPAPNVINRRYDVLSVATRMLVHPAFEEDLPDRERLKGQRIVLWAILQHYEVCPTPLLDVTQSLRIAASFGSSASKDRTAYLFVLGVPMLTGAITASSESGLQIVRLASACPPQAIRPHIQEGFLLAEYPELPEFDQESHYDHSEVDFGRRLIAKFRFDPVSFWDEAAFPKIAKDTLYPTNDPFLSLAIWIRSRAGEEYYKNMF